MKKISIALLLFVLSSCGSVKHIKAIHEQDVRYLERQNVWIVQYLKGNLTLQEMQWLIDDEKCKH